ncbi:Myb-like DNA-binding domain containing protein [Trichomonas vaginalis G3]|uniref:Myb-like DNA-binding domain containing protein n=1 Tax=Trichomonas vaginalis (strain ATCC PRA-98 / G3) TaxID=412133 RepID=A2DDK8_TRIV3|nr:glycolytic process regulation protein [Trichomonas vaginalis G3]EAY21384.1 Myb-like DNA-binding domain containing protein [Trichomonas vaginalis G3]KAI5490598.1 glycolytic process regulation protein [Trichomonas vaginalis G3]|eukprot:XP_001582370.1 Myb-like DNA-binding domain containing protein [Trichomonas vaginalis G3]
MDGQGKPDGPKVRVIRSVPNTVQNRQKEVDNQPPKPKRIEATPTVTKNPSIDDKPPFNSNISTILVNNPTTKLEIQSEPKHHTISQDGTQNVTDIQILLSGPVQQAQKPSAASDISMLVNHQTNAEAPQNNVKTMHIQALLQGPEPANPPPTKVPRAVSIIKRAEPIKVGVPEKKINAPTIIQSSPINLLNLQSDHKIQPIEPVTASTPYSLQSMINATARPASVPQPSHQKVLNPVVVKVTPKVNPPAAPYPELPTAKDVVEQIADIDKLLTKYKAELTELENERTYGMLSAPITSDAPASSLIQDFHGSIFSHSLGASIIEKNKEIAQRSKEKHKLPEPFKRQRFTHITHLPFYKKEDGNSSEMAEPIFQTICQRLSLADEKAQKLAIEYKERYELWNESNRQLSIYHKEAHEKIDRWPPEFDKCLQYIKPNDKTNTVHVAPDQIMYLDDTEKETYLYYDENSFVEDPVAAHLEYKNRLSWTENEKQTFLEKYAQHPREFKKIAAALPLKTIKDVIEYYNINRIKLKLGQIEKSYRKKGRRRVIIDESGHY